MRSLLYGGVLAAILVMTLKRGVNGLRTGKAVWFGGYRDWGPFERLVQPRLFYASIAWAFIVAVLSACGMIGIVTESI